MFKFSACDFISDKINVANVAVIDQFYLTLSY